MLIGEAHPSQPELQDLVLTLVDLSARFQSSLPSGMRAPLVALVRSMNCYYSNLIEGHDTHPIDIDRALKNEYSNDPRKRDLQREARAHIEVQAWIDRGGLTEHPLSAAALQAVHRRFYKHLPPELRVIRDPDTDEVLPVIPGELRTRHVRVGRHIPVSPGAVPRFLERYEAVYVPLRTSQAVKALAAAHHRLVWIHPFLDGNGRVARLISHASLLHYLNTGALWSPARGLARRIADYKAHLANCDQPRRNDLDGRGNLSQEALIAFTRFMLEVCVDQVRFMERLMQPGRLHHRVMTWAAEDAAVGALSTRVLPLLSAVLHRGEISRAEVGPLLGVSERQARRFVAPLLTRGVLTAEHARAPFALGFPIELADRWMPGLFPERDA
ncbi:MAG: Fic family protein [Burkholderiaceae bacterium]